MPSDIRSFIRSYLPATDENTSPTSFCLSPTGTSRKPKWVVPGSLGSLMCGLSPARPVPCATRVGRGTNPQPEDRREEVEAHLDPRHRPHARAAAGRAV